MSGDGGLTMLMGELLTTVEQDLDLTVVAFNNGALGMIRLEMMVAGFPSFQTDHGPADLGAIAAAAGLHAVTVTDPHELRGALRAALDHRGPVAGRRAHRPERAVDPPARHRGAGARVRPRRHADRARRRCREDGRPRPVQPALDPAAPVALVVAGRKSRCTVPRSGGSSMHPTLSSRYRRYRLGQLVASATTARAASSRATGTRNGEQET